MSDYYLNKEYLTSFSLQVTGMLSGGFSGFSVTHCDAGGYNSVTSSLPGFKMVRTKELLFRWMELAALTAAYRTTEGLIPSVNAQFYDNEGKLNFKFFFFFLSF